jgi:hypothetical protein
MALAALSSGCRRMSSRNLDAICQAAARVLLIFGAGSDHAAGHITLALRNKK